MARDVLATSKFKPKTAIGRFQQAIAQKKAKLEVREPTLPSSKEEVKKRSSGSSSTQSVEQNVKVASTPNESSSNKIKEVQSL